MKTKILTFLRIGVISMLKVLQGCPGTGKTTKLKQIFEEMVKGGTPVYETFRRNMAYDFISRLQDVYEEDLYWVGTTHAICFRLLKAEFNYTKENIAKLKHYKEFCRLVGLPFDERDMNLFADNDISSLSEVKSAGAVVYCIYSNCVNMLVDFDDWVLLPNYMKPPTLVEDVPYYIDKWLSFLERRNLIDFPLMLKKTYDLKMSPHGSVYLSDEFHDKTKIQFELFKLWSKEFDYVVVALDKNQTLYSFLGTNPKFCDYVMKKADEFVVLTPSYRLSEEVMSVATKLLKISGQEVFNTECKGHTKIMCVDLNTLERLVHDIKECMVLARTNYQLRAISSWLTDLGVIHTGRFGWSAKQLYVYSFVWKYRNKVYPIYKHELMAFLKAVEGRRSNLKFIESMLPSELNNKQVESILTTRHRMILSMRNPFNACDFSQDVINKMYIALEHNSDPRQRWFLTTIHGAKGLEADTVIVFDGITNKIVENMNRYEEEFANEYRVWYVALTRARKLCIVVDDSLFGYTHSFVYPIVRGDLHASTGF